MRAVIDGMTATSCWPRSAHRPPSWWPSAGWMAFAQPVHQKPVRSQDLKGQKVRMMGNPLFVDTMNAMGGNGISMELARCSPRCRPVWWTAPKTTRQLFTSNHYSTGAKFYTPDQPPDHSRAAGGVQSHLGQAVGRPGPAQEVWPPDPAGAARPLGQERGRLHRQAQGCGGVNSSM